MLKTLADYAKRIQTFLGFAVLIILVLFASFTWAFSRGAFDPLVENIKVLNQDQFFWIIITILSMVFSVVVLLIILSVLKPGPEGSTSQTSKQISTISINVHEEGDKTLGVAGATVTLTLSPEPQQKKTNELGHVIFFYPSKLDGKKFSINARKEGYPSRKPKEITLRNESQIDLPLISKPVRPPVLPKLTYFLYISDSKLHMLEEQITWGKQVVDSTQNRFNSLNSILSELEDDDQIGDTASNKPFIRGEEFVQWGIVDWGSHDTNPISFFFSKNTSPILLMAGSVHHLIDYKQVNYSFPKGYFGAGGSALPGIMQAIKFATDGHSKQWSEGIGGIHDYLFALGFVQGKFIDRAKVQRLETHFQEQKVKFVAKKLKRLKRPSEPEVKNFLSHGRMSERDKEGIRQMLRQAPDILICTPIFVALTDTE